MISGDRNTLRRYFVDTWNKHRSGVDLDPLALMVAGIIEDHPEYQPLLADEHQALAAEPDPAGDRENPFLHMGLHISLQEQLGADRPPGIRSLYQKAVVTFGDAHEAEHRMMECLGQTLWVAQRNGKTPDESRYLDCLSRLLDQNNSD